MKRNLSFTIAILLCSKASLASSFTLYLDNGYFFGPGNAVYNDTGIVGVNKFVDAEVRNIVLTGPLTGQIPFFNNGGDTPNVIAEQLQQGGVIDGLASDGTLINENADTALRLHFSDPETGETADLMVVAEASPVNPDGGEPIFADEKGNLVFNPSVLADPGQPDLISRFSVAFTTGAAEVPLSLKTQQNIAGGHDNAGPLPAGRTLIGRIGDYDQDGYMDGMLVLAGNAPMDLLVGRGNPIAQKRPWSSDIPIDPFSATMLTLNNIVQNYPAPLQNALDSGEFPVAIEYLQSIDAGLNATLGNLHRILVDENTPHSVKKKARKVRTLLQKARYGLLFAIGKIEDMALDKHHWPFYGDREVESIKRRLDKGLEAIGAAAKLMSGSREKRR